jgi:hypothetical protein
VALNNRCLLVAVLVTAVLTRAPVARGQSSGEDSTAAAEPAAFAADEHNGNEQTPEQEELESAEALLGRAELAELADPAVPGPAGAGSDKRRAPRARSGGTPAWQLSWRGGALGAAAGTTLRLEGRQGPARLLIRRRAAATGDVVWGGGLALRSGSGDLVGGTLGCSHGLGLLAAGAGRGSTPAATASLAPPVAGVRLLSAGDAERSLRGVSGALAGGRWGLTGVVGSLPAESGTEAGETKRPVSLARLACATARGEAALLVCVGEQANGVSLALTGRGPDAWYAGEAAAWRAGRDGRPELAWAAAAGVRRRGWLIEMQAAAADAGRGPCLGRPSPCLSGWAGSGWCVRASTALGSHVRAQALFASARERDEVDTGGVTTSGRRRCELALEAGRRAGWTVDLRLRQGVRTHDGWGDRSPWLPPARLETENRTQVVATVDGALAGWKIRLAARGLAVAQTEAGAEAGAPLARGLAEARAERLLGAGWSLRLAWAGAWGGPADLASCAAPAPGLAVPRRWGHWAGERSVGCARVGRRWTIAMGGCLRQPVDLTLPVQCELWQRAALNW